LTYPSPHASETRLARSGSLRSVPATTRCLSDLLLRRLLRRADWSNAACSTMKSQPAWCCPHRGGAYGPGRLACVTPIPSRSTFL
jgi:hypothetical protein